MTTPQYRDLEPNEVIQIADEFTLRDRIVNWGQCETTVGHRVSEFPVLRFRRPIKPEAQEPSDKPKPLVEEGPKGRDSLRAELEKVKAEVRAIRDLRQKLDWMHSVTCLDHTDAERKAAGCPVCLKRQLAEALKLPMQNEQQTIQSSQARIIIAAQEGVISALRLRVETMEKAYSAEKLAEIFIAWPLPDSVNSDPCVTIGGSGHRRTGTNLLTVMEARKMFEYILARAALDKKKEDSNL